MRNEVAELNKIMAKEEERVGGIPVNIGSVLCQGVPQSQPPHLCRVWVHIEGGT